jgi:hypothetical protein
MLTLSEPEVVSEPETTVEAPASVPSLAVAVPEAPRTFNRPWLSTHALVATWLMLLLLAIVANAAGAPAPVASWIALAAGAAFAATSVVAFFRVIFGVIALGRDMYRGRADDVGLSILAILGNLLMTGFGMLVAYVSTVGFARGRQLRHFGRVLLPGLRKNPDWATARMAVDDGGVPARLADQWRENGKTEHASVAAFARLTLDLMALGAPPVLIAAANRDALDEIRHTELCFSIARALDGQSVSPGPFPQAQRVSTLPRSRTLALAQLRDHRLRRGSAPSAA